MRNAAGLYGPDMGPMAIFRRQRVGTVKELIKVASLPSIGSERKCTLNIPAGSIKEHLGRFVCIEGMQKQSAGIDEASVIVQIRIMNSNRVGKDFPLDSQCGGDRSFSGVYNPLSFADLAYRKLIFCPVCAEICEASGIFP